MAITTLVNKIRAITKSTVALGVTDDNVVDELTSGCRFVMATAPKQLLASYAEGVTVSDANGYSYLNDTVLAVERNGSIATFMPLQGYYSESVSSASSLFKRSKLFPGVYNLRGKLYIKPDPTAGEPAVITCVKIPTLTAGTVEVFGILEEAVVQYACGLDYTALSNIFRDSAITELETITSTGYLVDFENAVPTYVSAVCGALPTAPSDITLPTVPDGVAFPVSPTLPTIPTENKLPSTPTTTLSAPSFDFTKPVVSPDYSTMDSNIASDDVEVAQAVSAKLSAQINEFQANIQNESAELNKQAEEYRSGISRYGAEWQAYQQEASSLLQDFAESLSKYSAQAQSQLQKYASDVQKASADIQSNTQLYSSNVQALVAEYNADVQKYAAQTSQVIQKYSADVQANMSEFQSNLSKARAYLEEAGIRLQTMAEYDRLNSKYAVEANQRFILAYKFMETHVTKFLGAQQNASA